MNYQKIYDALIFKRLHNPASKEFSYTENHHIIPRSIDRTLESDCNNIVNLSAREHFIAHALLVKIYKQNGDKEKYIKMLFAFDAMSKLYGSIRNPELRYKNHSNSKLYEIWKIELSNYIKTSNCFKGENSSSYGRKMYHDPITNKIKFFKEGDKIPKGWIKGSSDKFKNMKNTLNTIWVHNIETNEHKCLNKKDVEQFLINHPNFKKGMSPKSKCHLQHYNPTTGKKWITNLQLKESKLISKNEKLPNEWLNGRISNFDKYLEKYNDAMNERKQWHFIDFEKDITNKIIPRILKNKKI